PDRACCERDRLGDPALRDRTGDGAPGAKVDPRDRPARAFGFGTDPPVPEPDSDAGRPVRDPDRGREPVRSRVDSVETVVGAYPATVQHPRRSVAKRNRGRAAVDHDPGADCAGRRIEAKHDPLLVRHHHATPPLVPAAGADEPYRALASRY